MADHVAEDLQITIDVICQSIDPIDGAIKAGVSVHIAAKVLNALRDLRRIAFFRSFKKHVLHAMGKPRANPAFFMQTACTHPDLNAGQRMLVIFPDNEVQPVVQRVCSGRQRRQLWRRRFFCGRRSLGRGQRFFRRSAFRHENRRQGNRQQGDYEAFPLWEDGTKGSKKAVLNSKPPAKSLRLSPSFLPK